MKNYIGVDLGKQSSFFVIKDEKGKLLHSSKVFNDRTAIETALKPYRQFRLQGVLVELPRLLGHLNLFFFN